MDSPLILALLDALRAPKHKVMDRGDKVVAPCPLAPWKHQNGTDNNPSFYIRRSPGLSRYNCWSCNSSGSVGELVRELWSLSAGSSKGYDFKTANEILSAELDGADVVVPDYVEKSVRVEEQQDKPIPMSWLESFVPARKVPAAREYLLGRGLSANEITEYDLRWDSYRETVCFPIFNYNHALVGLRGRFIKPKDAMKYYAYKYQDWYNNTVWYGEQWADPDRTIVLVESVFDLVSVRRVYGNVIAALSTGIGRDKAARISMCGDVVTLFDYGKGGDTARTALSKYLKQSAIVHLEPSESQDDPGDMSPEELREVLQGYIPLK